MVGAVGALSDLFSDSAELMSLRSACEVLRAALTQSLSCFSGDPLSPGCSELCYAPIELRSRSQTYGRVPAASVVAFASVQPHDSIANANESPKPTPTALSPPANIEPAFPRIVVSITHVGADAFVFA